VVENIGARFVGRGTRSLNSHEIFLELGAGSLDLVNIINPNYLRVSPAGGGIKGGGQNKLRISNYEWNFEKKLNADSCPLKTFLSESRNYRIPQSINRLFIKSLNSITSGYNSSIKSLSTSSKSSYLISTPQVFKPTNFVSIHGLKLMSVSEHKFIKYIKIMCPGIIFLSKD